MDLTILQHPLVQAAISGAAVAFVIDLQAWKSWDDAKFNLGKASFRWAQGGVLSVVAKAGFGVLVG